MVCWRLSRKDNKYDYQKTCNNICHCRCQISTLERCITQGNILTIREAFCHTGNTMAVALGCIKYHYILDQCVCVCVSVQVCEM